MTHGSGRRTLPATVLAIMLTLLALAGCSSGRKSGPAQPTPTGATAAPISPHLPFGNPSQAGTDPNNRLVLRPQFAASWNARKRNANWVAWRLTTGDIGDTERSQFYSDPEIDTPSPKDYTGSGYDRGHLCPSKDRSDTPANNKAVFTMLNIIPQAPDNNRGPWEQAERFERSLAQSGREVYLIAGGAGSHEGFEGLFHGINVPKFTWKVIVALEKGKSFPDGQEQAQVFAILMPNNDSI
ncbi:MAG TPA: DNA/RNA non-specific endonuclease, partial [Blastocatellia bacterium]|nr:DNA/RNA non-specific endonuclease [Blastocatellia bacterium]